MGLAAVLIAGAGLVATAPAASAAALTITSPASGSLLPEGAVTVSGTGTAGDEVQLSESGSEPYCITVVDASETWSCAVDLADGPHRLVATELLADGSRPTTSIDVGVLSAPTITAADDGSATSAGSVRGTGYPGATVTATTADGASSCSTTADSGGNWFCQLVPALEAGSYSVSATQSAGFAPGMSSPASSSVTLTVDDAPPAAPTLTSPGAGDALPVSGATYSGTGEEGTRAYVYVDVVNTCEAPVIEGVWTCTGGLVSPGAHRVSAILGDDAGNYGPPSAWIDITFADSTSTPTPGDSATPTPSGSSTPTPQSTTPSATPSGSPSSTPAPGTSSATPNGSPTSAPTEPSDAPSSTAPAPSDGSNPAPPLQPLPDDDAGSGWSAATGMTTALSARTELGTFSDWVRSLILAAASFALVVAPARLAVIGRTPRDSATRRRWQFTGRNRARVEFDSVPETAPLSRRVVAIGVIGCASGLVLLSGPVDSQPAYLRLLLAVVISVVAVNVVAAGVPALVARRLAVGTVSALPAPKALILVAAAALFSRFVGLDPAFLFGVVVGLAMAPETSAADRAKLAATRVIALLGLAGAAWALSGAITPDGSFVSALVAEVLSATTLLSVGSAIVLLFPIGRPAGQAVLRWSPVLWLGLTLVAYTVLFLLLTPTIRAWQSDGGGGVLALSAVGFAAVCTSIWAWRRFIDEP
ncbi:hypothetical protein HQQ80_06405 [Microbacteriaceae bacterium VKM Ac-2855]|nr:hypothetical protein [Microbacteriaceae bacterium VKM Ac-2855]